jgi:hypothetical protein
MSIVIVHAVRATTKAASLGSSSLHIKFLSSVPLADSLTQPDSDPYSASYLLRSMVRTYIQSTLLSIGQGAAHSPHLILKHTPYILWLTYVGAWVHRT